MPDLNFTMGQLRQLAEAMGLTRDSDPVPTAGMLCAWAEAMHVIELEARHIEMFGLRDEQEDDGGNGR